MHLTSKSLSESFYNTISAIHCLAIMVTDALCGCLSFIANSAAAATATAAAAPSAELDVRYSAANTSNLLVHQIFSTCACKLQH
jgi:hypothetical protein